MKEIRWSVQASNQLEKAYVYISKDSPQNATKVKAAILAATKKLVEYPKMHPSDKYKAKNNGRYRAYEIHYLRILYKINTS